MTAPPRTDAGADRSLTQTPRRPRSSTPARAELAADTLVGTVARGVAAVGLAAIGLIHLLDAPGKYSETPYMFWMYLALIAGCLLGAVLLLRAHARLGWVAALVLSSSPFIGYVLSRTTGLPGAMADIGNWSEPLGLASLYVEACVFALGLYGLARLRRTQ
jgi:hypothetical protein